jgi:hypothetical protein
VRDKLHSDSPVRLIITIARLFIIHLYTGMVYLAKPRQCSLKRGFDRFLSSYGWKNSTIIIHPQSVPVHLRTRRREPHIHVKVLPATPRQTHVYTPGRTMSSRIALMVYNTSVFCCAPAKIMRVIMVVEEKMHHNIAVLARRMLSMVSPLDDLPAASNARLMVRYATATILYNKQDSSIKNKITTYMLNRKGKEKQVHERGTQRFQMYTYIHTHNTRTCSSSRSGSGVGSASRNPSTLRAKRPTPRCCWGC